jgi:histidine ammonia-lyase
VEEHAGFSTQSARATTDVIDAYRIVLGCELVAAVRALRLRGTWPGGPAGQGGPALAAAFELAAGALPADTADRALDSDLTAALGLLAKLAAFAEAPGT